MEAPQGVSWTSFVTCYARMIESRRPDRLFDDPWAGEFLAAFQSAPGGSILGPAEGNESSPIWELLTLMLAGRTPFYDRYVQAAIDDGVRQVVVLAAGMDARPLRLALPDDATVFEVDLAPIMDFKTRVLDGRGRSIPVVADLRDDWLDALTAAGFDPRSPTAWTVEGLLVYLDNLESDKLLGTISDASAPGSWIVTDSAERMPEVEDYGSTDPADVAVAEQLVSLFRTGPGPDPAAWLTRFGWRPSISTLDAEIRSAGRQPRGMFDASGTNPVIVWLAAGRIPENCGQESV